MPTPSGPSEPQVLLRRLADGVIVQLRGPLTASALPQLRRALLLPLPAYCRDVLVDAGEVTEVDDAAVAALIAAREWAVTAGRRFAALRLSPAVTAALDDVGLRDVLPLLGDPHRPESVAASGGRD